MSTTTTRRKASAAAFLSININRHFGLPFWIITKSLKMQEWLRRNSKKLAKMVENHKRRDRNCYKERLPLLTIKSAASVSVHDLEYVGYFVICNEFRNQ